MAKRRSGKTVLVIEDEAGICEFASRVCQLEGYMVLQAEDGNIGLKLARENPISLVLLDLRLPKCNGWEVLKQMKGDPELSSVPIVIFTASAAVSQRKRALTAGAADYLVKPLSADKLRKTIAHILRGK